MDNQIKTNKITPHKILAEILNKVGEEYIKEISFGRVLRIISNKDLDNNNTRSTAIC